MFACVCARVRECEIRAAVQCGARTEESVAAACGAGTGCGTCVDRIGDLIAEEQPADTLAAVAA